MATHSTGVDSAHRGPCNSNGFLTIGKPTALMPGTQKCQLARVNVEVLTPWHVDTCCTQLLAILRGSRFLKQRNWIGDTVPVSVASPLRFRWITISTRFSDTCARSKNVVTSEDYSDYSLFLRFYNVTLFQSPCACAANALSAGLSHGSKKRLEA